MPVSHTSCTIDSDILPCIFEVLRDNYDALYKCSLVCKEFNSIASRLLYRHVVFSPPFQPYLNLRDRGTPTVSVSFMFITAKMAIESTRSLCCHQKKGIVSIYVRMSSAIRAVGGRTENQR
jgi:hypothetical protein